MISQQEYRKDPCRALSIPYWKAKSMQIPQGMRIVHDTEFCPEDWVDYVDEIYFRLYYKDKNVQLCALETCSLRTVTKEELDIVVDIINRSYRDIRVDRQQLEAYRAEQTTIPVRSFCIAGADLKETIAGMCCGERPERQI